MISFVLTMFMAGKINSTNVKRKLLIQPGKAGVLLPFPLLKECLWSRQFGSASIYLFSVRLPSFDTLKKLTPEIYRFSEGDEWVVRPSRSIGLPSTSTVMRSRVSVCSG